MQKSIQWIWSSITSGICYSFGDKFDIYFYSSGLASCLQFSAMFSYRYFQWGAKRIFHFERLKNDASIIYFWWYDCVTFSNLRLQYSKSNTPKIMNSLQIYWFAQYYVVMISYSFRHPIITLKSAQRNCSKCNNYNNSICLTLRILEHSFRISLRLYAFVDVQSIE